MRKPHLPALNRPFTVAGFLAVPVVAIILISGAHPEPESIAAAADLLVAYLTWRTVAGSRHGHDAGGPRPA